MKRWRRRILPFIIVVGILFGSSPRIVLSGGVDSNEVFSLAGPKALRESVVRIEYMDDDELVGIGSGFYLQNMLITNSHVAGDQFHDSYSSVQMDHKLRIIEYNGNTEEIRSVKAGFSSRSQDIVVFRMSGKRGHFNGYVLPQDLNEGDRLWCMGNPKELAFNLRSGQMASVFDKRNREDNEVLVGIVESLSSTGPLQFSGERYSRLIVATPLAEPGFSGAPVVDDYGRLAGVLFAGSNEYSLIIPIDEIDGNVALHLNPQTTSIRDIDQRKINTNGKKSPYKILSNPKVEYTPFAVSDNTSHRLYRFRLDEEVVQKVKYQNKETLWGYLINISHFEMDSIRSIVFQYSSREDITIFTQRIDQNSEPSIQQNIAYYFPFDHDRTGIIIAKDKFPTDVPSAINFQTKSGEKYICVPGSNR